MSTPQPRFFRIYSLCWRRWAFFAQAAEQYACRRSGETGLPQTGQTLKSGLGPSVKRPPPAPDQGAGRPPGNSGSMRLSSISPAYTLTSPAAGTRTPGHSWRTTYHKGADGCLLLPGKFAGHGLTSRQPGLSKVPGSRTHSRCPASRDTRSNGSPWAASAWPEPGDGASASSLFQRAVGKSHLPASSPSSSSSSQGGPSSSSSP